MEKASHRFGMNGLAILLLRLLSKHSTSVHEGQLKSGLRVLFTLNEFEEALTDLKALFYVASLPDGTLQIDGRGKQFLEQYDLYEDKELLEGNLVYIILKYLTELNDSISPAGFPRSIVDAAPRKYYGADAENLNHFLEFDEEMRRYVSVTRDGRYALNNTGQSRYQIELKKRAKMGSFNEYVALALDQLEKNADFVANIMKEYGVVDPTVVTGIEAYLNSRGLVGLTNKGAYLTPIGRAYLAQLKLNDTFPGGPAITIQQITTHGDNSPVATGGTLSMGTIENKNAPTLPPDPGQRKALSISRHTLFWTILATLAAIGSLVLAYLAWIKH